MLIISNERNKGVTHMYTYRGNAVAEAQTNPNN